MMFLSGFFKEILTGTVFLLALILSWWKGRRSGLKTQQLKAEKEKAQLAAEQVIKANQTLAATLEAVQDVQTQQDNLNDDAIRERMHSSPYHYNEPR